MQPPCATLVAAGIDYTVEQMTEAPPAAMHALPARTVYERVVDALVYHDRSGHDQHSGTI